MEQHKDSRTCLIVWRGQKLIVEINPSSTLKELGEKLMQLTNVKADTLRLLVPVEKSSKLLYPFSEEHACLVLETTPILKAKTIRMMGVLKDEIDEVLENAKMDLRIAGFDEEEKRLRQRNIDTYYPSRKLPGGTYVFCDFRTLSIPGIECVDSYMGKLVLRMKELHTLLNPPASKALELLHMLASDPGIVAIMNKHRWRVGILTEMAPIGYVGVSPKCILGFNKNCGEEISLRLRTDDLKGFRKYDSIKKTLLHELAHMVYSEHDTNFYALDSQLNKEAATLDWTKSRGHTLNGVSHSQNNAMGLDINSSEIAAQKLGGRASILPNASASSIHAAFERLAKTSTPPSRSSEEITAVPDPDDIQMKGDKSMEPDPDDGDKSMEPESCIQAEGTQVKIVMDIDDIQISNRDGSGVSAVGPNSSGDIQRKINVLDTELDTSSAPSVGPHESQTEVMQLVPESVEAISGSEFAEPDPDDPELKIIQDPVTVTCRRLQNAIELLKNEAGLSEVGTVLQTIIKIIRNVTEHPDEMKFKKLRKANPTIQKNILRHKAAVDILAVVGFSEDVIIDEFGKADSYLVLKRNDPGMLWLAKSSLETYVV